MNALQFIATSSLLFFLPYAPPAFIGWQTYSGRNNATRSKILRFLWLAELLIVFFVFASSIYLSEIDTMNGLINDAMFRAPNGQLMETLWEGSRYLLAVIGIILGAAVFYLERKNGSKMQSFRKSTLLFGSMSLLYGLAVPFLMKSFLVAILDSHLM